MPRSIKRMIRRPSWPALKWVTCFLLSLSLCVPSWASCLCDCSIEELHESKSSCCQNHHAPGHGHHHEGHGHHHHHHDHKHNCECHKCPSSSPVESRTIEVTPTDPIECYRFCEITQECECRTPRRPLPTDWQNNRWATNSVSMQVLLCVWTN